MDALRTIFDPVHAGLQQMRSALIFLKNTSYRLLTLNIYITNLQPIFEKTIPKTKTFFIYFIIALF
jgi:hypothetical protein